MTKYLLDTSVLIDHLRHKNLATEFITSHLSDNISTSAICEAELNEGIYREKPENINKRIKERDILFEGFSKIIAFDREQADIAGKIRADLGIKGSPIGDLDVLIAAAAIANNAVLVTKNPIHFSKIPGLSVFSG